MGYLAFRGEPFDVIAERLPSAIAENGIVVATLPMFASGFPDRRRIAGTEICWCETSSAWPKPVKSRMQPIPGELVFVGA
jgi:hypothetical protein